MSSPVRLPARLAPPIPPEALRRHAPAPGEDPQPLASAAAARLVDLLPVWMRDLRAEMREAAPEGLSVPLFRVLIFARMFPGGSISEAAAHLGVALPTASVAIDKLVGDRLLRVQDAPGSRRTRAIFLTDAGTAVVARSMDHTIGVFAGRLSGLDAPALHAVLQALSTLELALTLPLSAP